MDGLFHVKPYEQRDDLGGFSIIFGSTMDSQMVVSLMVIFIPSNSNP